jgi:hypothetical protein
MGNYEYATSIGSGTVPHIQRGPIHNLPEGAYPVPDQRNALKTRRGDGAIILNPEDFSVNIGLTTQAITVSTSAVPLPTNPLEYRRALVVHNAGSVDVFLGDSTVTVSTGLPLAAGEKIAFDIQGNPNVEVYAICATSSDVRIMELA